MVINNTNYINCGEEDTALMYTDSGNSQSCYSSSVMATIDGL